MAELTPLSELDGYSSEKLAWRVALPDYVPADWIGINIPKVEKLAHIAGLGHLRIVSAGDEGSTQYQASVVGGDAQGNAVAGKSSAINKAELLDTDVNRPDGISDALYEYSWGDGTISINSAELTDRIVRGRIGDGSLRSGRAWSHQLDRAVRRGIRQTAKDQLISNVPGAKAVILGFATAVGVGFGAVFDHANWYSYPRSIASFWTGFQASAAIEAKGNHGLPLSEMRLSLIPSYQVDRLAVVQGLTRASRLIKNLE